MERRLDGLVPTPSTSPDRSAGMFEGRMEALRPILIKMAVKYIKKLDRRIAAPIQDIAEDAVQKAIISTARIVHGPIAKRPKWETFEQYLRSAVERQCINHFREVRQRKESFAGSATDISHRLEMQAVNADMRQAPPGADRGVNTSQSLWSYALEGYNPFTGAEGFKRPEGMSEVDFARGIEIIRGYMFGVHAIDIAKRLQNLELLSQQEYNLEDSKDQKRALQIVYQVYKRMMKHLRTSMEGDGFLKQLSEES